MSLYRQLDSFLAPASRRYDALLEDLGELDMLTTPPEATALFGDELRAAAKGGHERLLTGAAYVLVGGNLMGGELLRRKLKGRYPVRSFESPDRVTEMAILRQYRQRTDCVLEARRCFGALLAACDEVMAVAS